jgi:hypothetical protein
VQADGRDSSFPSSALNASASEDLNSQAEVFCLLCQYWRLNTLGRLSMT